MRQVKLVMFVVTVMLTIGVVQARADLFSDDAAFCCAQTNNQRTTALAMINPFVPMVLGCKAIDGSPQAVSACIGVVLGCSDSTFVCQPSVQYPGLVDCECRLLLGGAMF